MICEQSGHEKENERIKTGHFILLRVKFPF
jgi:hypothetical protein